MEKPCYLYCDTACSRQPVGASFAKRHGSLCDDEQAGSFAAGVAVSGGLDDPVYPDGDRILSGTYIREAERRRTDGICDSALLQFFLVDPVFQAWLMYLGVYLARSAVAFDCSNSGYVLSDRKGSRVSDDPLSVVGSFCGILKSRYLPFELEHHNFLIE